MRKILSIILSVLIVLSLSSCAVGGGFSADSHDYLIAALGFDQEDEKITVSLEAVIVNSEDSLEEKKAELLTAGGKTLEQAFQKAITKATQPIELSHCAVVAIGEGVSKKRFDEICEFLYNERQINLSVILVSCQNAKELLSSNTVSSVAVGYDIMGMASRQANLTGFNFKNRFYEVESVRRGAIDVVALPYFEKNEASFSINGINIFENGSSKLRLNNKESFIYALACDLQNKGEVLVENKKYKIEENCTTFKFNKDKEIEINIKLKINDENVKPKIEKRLNELITLSKSKAADIFGIGNFIYHTDREFFATIKDNYSLFYKNLKFKVRVK